MARFDVFVAYARPNEPHARELYEALAEALGSDRVFFDRELPPGTLWREETPKAVADSRITAAVLARTPDGGWYDKEEFAIAIDEMRHGDHLVIPVFVDGTPERVRDWPYGLGGISAIDAQALSAVDAHGRGGMGAVAEDIVGRLRSLPAPGAPAPRPRTRRELLNAALHLDRADQWGAIQKIAKGSDNGYFLLYGQTFQNLRLFIERILHRLGEEVRPHLVLQLPYRLDQAYASNVHEWEGRLLMALKERQAGGSGSVADLLSAAASTQPLFLVIELPWAQRFEEPQKQALRKFVETRLPELIGKGNGAGGSTAGGGKGVRLLVAAEYLKREHSRHREVSAWMRQAVEKGIQYEPMAEVETPSRGDVVAYLERQGFYEGQPVFDDVMTGYDELASDPRLDFRTLSDFLDAHLDSSAASEDEEGEEY